MTAQTNTPARVDDAQSASASGAISLLRQATDVAHVCREIVLQTVIEIAGRRYVQVEGWIALAVVHGCIASIKLVEDTPSGVRAVAVLKRQSDGAELSSAEGFVGRDEPDWYGGTVTRLDKKARTPTMKTYTLEKRPDHAIRSMAQTRAIARTLCNGFRHVILLIDAGLATVPAEEIQRGDANDEIPEKREEKRVEGDAKTVPPPAEKKAPEVPREEVVGLRDQFRDGKWRKLKVHFGEKTKDKELGEIELKSLRWWVDEWAPKQFGTRPIPQADLVLRAALDVAGEEERELDKFRK
jgi:hypothetical protein